MNEFLKELGKHFLSIGLAVIVFVLVKFGLEKTISWKTALTGIFFWVMCIIIARMLFIGGEKL